LGNIKILREQLKESATKKEQEAFKQALSLEVCCLVKVNNEQEKHDHFHAAKDIENGNQAAEKVQDETE
jgi:predicted RNA-binding Zn ribbon-like protein